MSSIPRLECRALRKSLEADDTSNRRKGFVGGDQGAVCNNRMPRNRKRCWGQRRSTTYVGKSFARVSFELKLSVNITGERNQHCDCLKVYGSIVNAMLDERKIIPYSEAVCESG